MSALGWARRATEPILCPDFLSLPLKAAPSVTPNKPTHLPISQFQVLSTVSVKMPKIQTMCEHPLFQAFHREETGSVMSGRAALLMQNLMNIHKRL